MTTLEFLKRILPADGTHYLAAPIPPQGFMKHKAFDSLEALASALVVADKQLTVYHACASYLQPFVNGVDRLGNPKKLFRKPINWSRAKAFWIDIDCGQAKFDEGKGYLTKKAAWEAVDRFCRSLNLSLPMVVDSGYGIHCYWPLEESVGHEDWRATAALFKAVLKHQQVVVDDSRTADFASILRPVGTTNKKDPANPRPVKLKLDAEDIPYEVFHEIMERYVEANNVTPQPVRNEDTDLGIGAMPEYLKSVDTAADELTTFAYPEKTLDANRIAEHCQQVRAVRVDDGKGYNHWFGVMGLVAYCRNPLDVAHEWSKDHSLYDEYATTQKIETWSGKPTLCATLEQHNPGGCDGCPHRGSIKSPISLGEAVPEPKEEIITVVKAGRKVEVTLPAFPEGFTYNVAKKEMVWAMETHDKKGTPKVVDVPFCNVPFYPIARIVGEDKEMSVVMKAHMRDGQIKQLTMKTEIAGVGGRDIRKYLGAYEIVVAHHPMAPRAMDAFIRASITKLMEEAREVGTHTTFGWNKEKTTFLHGKKLYSADGSVVDVRLAGQAAVKEDVFDYNVQDPKSWSESVNFIYNRPGMEMYQYTILSALGSVLTPFGESTYHGIPVALTSTHSALGKTTASKVALTAWGDADSLKITGEQGATTLARYTLLGAMNNIPMLMDELTTAKPEFVGDMLYAMSNGLDRIRVRNVNGEQVLSKANRWNSANFITGNTRIASALASVKVDSEAESVRVFEIYVNKYEAAIPMLPVEDMAKHTEVIMGNPGAAGAAFIHYVVQNRDEVLKLMASVQERVSNSARAVRDSQYRFYRQHATCTLTAAHIAKRLGLIDFDLDVLHQWAASHIEQLCIDVVEMNTMSSDEVFNRMVNDLQSRIIASETYQDARATVPQEIRMFHPPVGRWIMGGGTTPEPLAGRLFLTRSALREWCGKNRADLDEILGWAKVEGILIPFDSKFNISRGTTLPPMQHPVFCFDIAKAEVIAPGALQAMPRPGTPPEAEAA